LGPFFISGEKMAQASDKLMAIIEPAVSALGFELLGVEYMPQGRHSLLRIYIDHEDGITVDDCGDVSHQVSAVLDVEDPIRGEYTLEVSSPGLDRPLFTLAHYERYSGNQAEIRLHAPLHGRRKFKGRLQGVEDDEVIIEVDGEEYRLAIGNIEKAHLVHEW
jgi:ribosome maturation factor RimP